MNTKTTEESLDELRALALASASNPDAHAKLETALASVELEPVCVVAGLAVSPYPSARFCVLRFVEAAMIDADVRDRFVRPLAELPNHVAAFIDPRELSFHNFENIIGLDHMISAHESTDVWLGGVEPLRETPGDGELGTRMKLLCALPLREELERIAGLELYAAPFRTAARGGQRFIFHCAGLAVLLEDALRHALPEAMLDRFAHVNPVFRCSRFARGDARFAPHVDGAYFDPARGHVSKYTMLIYLSGGRGQAALRLGELTIDEIEAMTVIVFDQSLVHEGGPFDGLRARDHPANPGRVQRVGRGARGRGQRARRRGGRGSLIGRVGRRTLRARPGPWLFLARQALLEVEGRNDAP